jgi:hypothetical protein
MKETSATNVVFSPASKAQEQFLNSQADITFYGGGHKRLRLKPI